MRGEGLYSEGEPQNRLRKLPGRASFLAHHRDGCAGQNAGVPHREVELVGRDGVVSQVYEMPPARRRETRDLLSSVKLLPKPRHPGVYAPCL